MANLQQVHKGSADKPAIILIHGLGGHPIDTWRHSACKENDCWPHWIGQETDSDTWLLDYDADLSAWRDQAMPLPKQGDQVLDLLDSKTALREKELILVGHSMGGLVIKTLVVRGRSRGINRFNTLVNRVRGVVFIATPHAGSHLANLARAARWVLRTNVQVGNMTAHDPHLQSLHEEFRHALQALKCDVHGLAETHGVRIGPRFFGWHIGWCVMVVNASSGDVGLYGVANVPMAGDHFSICKPKDRDEQIHLSLCRFIGELPNLTKVLAGPASSASVSPAFAASPVSAAPPATHANPVGAPAELLTTPSPNQLGRLTGPDDNRIQPRESRVYGREAEVSEVLAFLRHSGSPVATSVVGIGGTGKTEVCKAALKAWLAENRDAAAYYVALGDRANAAELISGLASALGATGIDSAARLLAVVPPATYYLDNVETVVERAEGQELLRVLANRPGVRLLTSSRVEAPGILGRPIKIGALPDNEAVSLFRDLWTGTDALPDDAALGRFVVNELGGHALSVTLTARLGDCYSYASLLERWANVGPDLLEDFEDQSRLGSLSVSLRLTADALSSRKGALALWTAASLFPGGVPEQLLDRLENEGGWSAMRPALVRHHLLARRNGRLHMLPPVARFALLASARAQAGFDWTTCRGPIRAVFEPALSAVANTASTDESLAARRWILENFEALTRLMRQELSSVRPDLAWVEVTHVCLVNTYQLVAAQSLELLTLLVERLPHVGSVSLVLGDVELRLGRPDAARTSYNRSVELYKGQQDGVGEANTLRALGHLERRLGRNHSAHDLYTRAHAIFEKEQEGLGQANTLRALGEVERELGRSAEARALFDRALRLFEKEQNRLGEANTLVAFGELERRLGHPEDARAYFNRALVVFTKEQDTTGQANSLMSLGDIEVASNQFDAALELYDRGLEIHEREQAGLGQANALQAIGDILRMRGDFVEAAKTYQRALVFYAQEQEPMGTAFTCSELARCHHALGDEQQRDRAMLNAVAAASQSQLDFVTSYVKTVLIEIAGSPEAAHVWRDRYGLN